MFKNIYRGKRVFLTGHTGFKGSWLAEWLTMLGAEVYGYALNPQSHDLLFDQLGLASRLAADHREDLANLETLAQAIKSADPDFVFHLAAQPLVRLSYEIPLETFMTNVIGTAHLLDVIRKLGKACTVLCVTTDKCYENREWLHSYRENDAMGGHDPYSASKGAAELVIGSYRNSFFTTKNSDPNTAISLASARAGNVIGGGDWALDRIVPDCIRALRAGKKIPVRNKIATRPWQHVLEPLSGYLWLAAQLSEDRSLATAFNFGPALTSNRTVAELVQELLKHLPGSWIDASDPCAVHEASKLNLAIDKAFHLLQWQPVWNFEETISQTASWYDLERKGDCPRKITQHQIQTYHQQALTIGLPWASAE